MLGGSSVRVLIWTGTIPTPPSPAVAEALRSVQVTSDARQGDVFQLTFAVAKGVFDFDLLDTGAMSPMTRVVVAAVFGVVPEVLIDGLVTHVQLAPGDQPGESSLTVTGKDLSLAMDLEERNAEYPNQPDFVIFSQLVARYAQYGLIPNPTPTSDVPIMLDRVPRQAETDLRFIQRMATRNGYVFYIEPVTIGVNRAYFGPEVRAGFPQSALTLNMGAHSNVDRIDFQTDAMAPEGTSGSFIEPFTKMALPIPTLPSLKLPPLSLMPAPPLRKKLFRSTANESFSRVAVSAVAAATNSPDAVRATTEVDAARYGGVIRSRGVIGVRGVGFQHDGLYYVQSVTHSISQGAYRQRVSMSREGTGPLLPVVVP